jgi:hypothetical protein
VVTGVRTPPGALVALDGVDGAALLGAARAALATRPRGGISRWDASGVFQDLAVADRSAGAPSARTLLLLYAADLAFRLRWQIRPALAEGRTVIAAPYVDTAMAFGRVAGLPATWLSNLFRFAPRAAERRIVNSPGRKTLSATDGFVGFSCERVAPPGDSAARRRLVAAIVKELKRRERR